MSLEINIVSKDNTKIEVAVFGDVDIDSSAKFKEELNTLVDENEIDIHINLEQLVYIDSTGLGILIGIMKKTKEKKCEMILLKPQPNMLKLLKITGLDKIFKIQ